MANDSLTVALTGHTNQPDLVTTPAVYEITVTATTGDTVFTVGEESTDDIPVGTTASDLQTALLGFDGLDTGEVTVVEGEDDVAYVITITDLQGTGVPVLSVDNGTDAYVGGDVTAENTVVSHVQGSHTTQVITDPEDEDFAVQIPVEQQTGGLNAQDDPSAEDTFSA